MSLPVGRWFLLLSLGWLSAVGPACGDAETTGTEETTPEVLCVQDDDCTTSCGTAGSLACGEDETAPGECAPPVEAANGQDDDCDGEIDEGIDAECEAGVIQPCLSFCATTGQKTCDQEGQWSSCKMEPESNLSMHCNGKDDDCDDSIDEDIGFLTCGAGDCAYQLPACVDGDIQACPTEDGTDGLCDGLDDDCDGQIDEDSPIECDPLTAVSTLEDCTTSECPSQWSLCVADSACIALLNCMGECPWLGDPICGDGKCTGTEGQGFCTQDCEDSESSCGDGACEHNEPHTCEQDCESQVEEANACVEDCIAAGSGAPPLSFQSLGTCADTEGCLNLDGIDLDPGTSGGGSPTCGNGVCQFDDGESEASCPEDCAGVPEPQCSNVKPCPTPAYCEVGMCKCPSGMVCGDYCIDLENDEENCGSCDNVCPTNGTCSQGQCECASNAKECGDVCASVGSDPDHCGDCFQPCALGMICEVGSCEAVPPRPIAPLSGSIVSSPRPTMEVELPEGGESTLVTVCYDRICQSVATTFAITGSSGKPPQDLPEGVLFWRSQSVTSEFTGTELSPVWSFTVSAGNAPVDTAWGASTDFNMDGLSDVLVGGCGLNACTSSAFIHFSSAASGVSPSPDEEIPEPEDGLGGFGYAVASAGDANGDGYPDIVIGCGILDGAYVFPNGPEGVDTVPWAQWSVPVAFYGHSVASAGDVNRDGYADVAVGAMLGNFVDIFMGGPDGVSPTPSAPLSGPVFGLGISVDSAGDVNGDGYSDVIAGAANSDSALVFHGGPDGLETQATTTMSGTGTFGVTVAGVGDVNGDGYTDVAVGAIEAGEAHLFLGGPDGVSATPEVTMTAPGINDFGYFVARAGDVNADGFSDVLIGGSGGAQLFLGNSGGLLQVSNLNLLPPPPAREPESSVIRSAAPAT